MPGLLTQFSRRMRKRPTPAERRFKKVLATCCVGLGISFEEQKVFWNHKDQRGIIADFYISRCRINFEVDGGYHDSLEQKTKDDGRDQWFSVRNIKVIRLTNKQTEDEEYCKNLIIKSFDALRWYKRSVKKITTSHEKRRKILARCPTRIENGITIIECPTASVVDVKTKTYKVRKPKKKKGKCKLEPPGSFSGSIYWRR